MSRWPLKPLGEICSTSSGGTPSRSHPEYFGGEIPWIKSGDLTDGEVVDCDETITEEALQNSSAKLFQQGTVLIAMYGATVGKLGMLGREAATNQAVCGISTPDELDRWFLFYFLLSQRRKLIEQSTGGAQPNISQKIVRELLLPVPLLPEQRHIVDVLSRAAGIVRLRREAQKKAAELISALFTDMFGDPEMNPKGWPLVKISDVCGKCTTRDPKRQPDEEFTYIDIAAIDNERGQVSEAKTVLGADAPSRARQVVEAGDVIVSTVRPNLRGSAWIPAHLDGQVCSTGFCVLRPSGKTTTGFMYALIRSEWFVSEVMKHVRGAQYPAVSDKDIFGLQIPFPPLDDQQKFSRRLEAVLSIQSQQTAAAAKAQATFDALLARVFS